MWSSTWIISHLQLATRGLNFKTLVEYQKSTFYNCSVKSLARAGLKAAWNPWATAFRCQFKIAFGRGPLLWILASVQYTTADLRVGAGSAHSHLHSREPTGNTHPHSCFCLSVKRCSAKELYIAMPQCVPSKESSEYVPANFVFFISVCQDTTQKSSHKQLHIPSPSNFYSPSVFRVITTPSTDKGLYCSLENCCIRTPLH